MTPGRRLLWGAIAIALVTACHPVAMLTPGIAPGVQADQGRFALQGRAWFPDRTVQIAPATLTSYATITLINASNQTVATARTDAAGSFTLLPGASFSAAAGDIFYLDAYKGTRNNAVGSDVARMRTILQWTSSGWSSTSGGTVVVNPLTTAVCVIQGLQSGSITPQTTVGTVSGTTVTSGNATIANNWSPVRDMVADLLAKDQDPLSRIAYLGTAYTVLPNKAQMMTVANFAPGTLTNTRLDTSGSLILGGPRPAPADPMSEQASFSCASVAPDAVGICVSDGSYLYVRAWNTINLNTNNGGVFKKIGTGFNGTIRGHNYGTVGPATANTTSAAYWKGAIYLPIGGNATQLQQLSTTTGQLTTIDVPQKLIFRETGTSTGGSSMELTSDGTYLYNVAYRINNGSFNGFTVQVLDPSQGMQQVRLFTMDNNSYYADGVFCDGTYVYPIEWNSASSASRIRRYRLSDGALEAESTFVQAGYDGTFQPNNNNPISGTWDPVNRVFWMGNLSNDVVHMLKGGRYIPSGSWTSGTLDTGSSAPYFGRLSWTGDPRFSGQIGLQVRSANDPTSLNTAEWYGPTGTTDSYTSSGTPLNPVHAKNRYFQIRATLTSQDLVTTPTLSQVSVEVLP